MHFISFLLMIVYKRMVKRNKFLIHSNSKLNVSDDENFQNLDLQLTKSINILQTGYLESFIYSLED